MQISPPVTDSGHFQWTSSSIAGRYSEPGTDASRRLLCLSWMVGDAPLAAKPNQLLAVDAGEVCSVVVVKEADGFGPQALELRRTSRTIRLLAVHLSSKASFSWQQPKNHHSFCHTSRLTEWPFLDEAQAWLSFSGVLRVGTTTVCAQYWCREPTSHLWWKWSWARSLYAWPRAGNRLPPHVAGAAPWSAGGVHISTARKESQVAPAAHPRLILILPSFHELTFYLLRIILNQLAQMLVIKPGLAIWPRSMSDVMVSGARASEPAQWRALREIPFVIRVDATGWEDLPIFIPVL